MAAEEDRKVSQDRSNALAVEREQGLRSTEVVFLQETPARHVVAPVDPVKTEELRRADERLARVRDGRGFVYFDR
jgi:hypothetical protein